MRLVFDVVTGVGYYRFRVAGRRLSRYTVPERRLPTGSVYGSVHVQLRLVHSAMMLILQTDGLCGDRDDLLALVVSESTLI